MKKILLLGHTGFLGMAVLKKLQGSKFDSITTASLSNGLDLRDFNATHEFIKRVAPDVIINCASYVGGIQFGLENKTAIYFNNMLMNISLYQAVNSLGVEKVIHPVSNCTYPSKFDLYEDDKWWDGEMHPTVEIYGFTKKAIHIAGKSISNPNFNSTELIFPNLYGPNDHMNEYRAHALGALCLRFIKANRSKDPKVVIWGTGKPIREWLHVYDAADSIVASISHPSPKKPINVSVGKGLSIDSLANKIKNIVNKNILIEYDTSKEDGAYSKILKPSEWLKEINWKPEFNIDEGLRSAVISYNERI